MKKPRYSPIDERIKTLDPALPPPGRWSRGFLAARAALLAAPPEDFNGKPPGKQLGAAIFLGNRLLSTGNNGLLKTVTFPENKIDGSDAHYTIHAEQAAVLGIRHMEYTGLICYVVRLDVSGNYVTSKPCQMCRKTLSNHGVDKVRYINNQGLFEEMRL